MIFLILFISHGGYGEVVNTVDCGSIIRGFDPHYSSQIEIKGIPKGVPFLVKRMYNWNR